MNITTEDLRDLCRGAGLPGADVRAHDRADEVAVRALLTVWRVVDTESGTRLERDPDVAALRAEVARG